MFCCAQEASELVFQFSNQLTELSEECISTILLNCRNKGFLMIDKCGLSSEFPPDLIRVLSV